MADGKPMDYITMIQIRFRNDYSTSIERLIEATVIIECGGNFKAIGKSNDKGAFQITPVRLKDYNKRTGHKYSMDDMFNFQISKEIFLYYANKIGIEPNKWEIISRQWNGGPIGHKKQITLKYWQKVSKQLKKNIMDKYTTSPDLFHPEIINLFDGESGICIGIVTPLKDGQFHAAPVGKISAKFSMKSIAIGYVAAAYYGTNKTRTTSDATQSILIF